MPQQWNFWGFPVTIRGQTGRYWGDLPNTFDIRFAPTDTWAFTMLQTMRVWEQHDSGTAFAQLSFTGYDFIDENWVPRTNDVSAPDNTWNKTAYIAEYGMTAVRVESLNRNVSAKGFVKLEFWSEPWRSRWDQDFGPSRFRIPADWISDYRTVALHDDENVEIVAQHSFITLQGGGTIDADAALAAALDKTDRDHHAARRSEAETSYRKGRGMELLPVERMKASVSTEPALLGRALGFDAERKLLVALPDED